MINIRILKRIILIYFSYLLQYDKGVKYAHSCTSNFTQKNRFDENVWRFALNNSRVTIEGIKKDVFNLKRQKNAG